MISKPLEEVIQMSSYRDESSYKKMNGDIQVRAS